MNKIIVTCGFATGAEKQDIVSEGKHYHFNLPSWFSVTRTYKNVSMNVAIEKCRKVGYSKSDDICADWVFSVSEVD
jgi:hypothetical protein